MADFSFRRRFDSDSGGKKEEFVISQSAVTPGHTFRTNVSGGSPVAGAERAKPVASKRKRDALIHTCIYHLPPVAITAFFTVIYVQEWTWPYPGPSDEVLAALQFAAKIHECLIIASISNILHHRIRFLLLQSDGIPLGLVTTPFQLNNPLYFVSAEFLGTLGKLWSSFSIFITFGLVVVVAILSLAASPFSAVILIPRQLRLELPETHNLTQSLLKLGADGSRGLIHGPRDDTGTYLLETIPISITQMYPMSIGPDLNLTWRCPPLADRPGNCISFFNQRFPDILLSSTSSVSKDFIELPPSPSGLTLGGNSFRLTAFLTDFDIEQVALNDTLLSGSVVRVACPLKITYDNIIFLSISIQRRLEDETPNPPSVFALTSFSSLPPLQPQVLSQACFATIQTNNLSIEYLTSLRTNISTFGIELDGEACFGTGLYPAFSFSFSETVASQLISQN